MHMWNRRINKYDLTKDTSDRTPNCCALEVSFVVMEDNACLYDNFVDK